MLTAQVPQLTNPHTEQTDKHKACYNLQFYFPLYKLAKTQFLTRKEKYLNKIPNIATIWKLWAHKFDHSLFHSAWSLCHNHSSYFEIMQCLHFFTCGSWGYFKFIKHKLEVDVLSHAYIMGVAIIYIVNGRLAPGVRGTQEPRYNATWYNAMSDTMLFFLGSQIIFKNICRAR